MYDGSPMTPTRAQISSMLCSKKRVKELRTRLGSISWYMKSLNEFIARRANVEDQCKGRFWEGRFKCIRLEDESAILSCAVYIDLNPIRANAATSLDENKFTSIYERIRNHKPTKSPEPELWLNPIQDTPTRKGFLSMSFMEYLAIVDATGGELRNGKKGRIPPHIEPILKRLGIRSNVWSKTSSNFGKMFSSVAGRTSSMVRAAQQAKRFWYKGIHASKLAFC